MLPRLAVFPASPGHRIATTPTPDRGDAAGSVAAMNAADLATLPLFGGMSGEQLGHIATSCEELEVEEGTVLLREGDFGHAVFAIRSGTADVVHDGAVINTLGPGDYFGEIAVMSGGRRSASVVATSPLRLVTIFNREIWRLEREAPEIASVLRSTIAARVGDGAQSSG